MVEGKADLHIHSTYSDGELAPAELVHRAKEIGLSVISISDHDTIEGVGEAESVGRESGVEVIPATELSAIFRGMDIHILGYYIDIGNRGLARSLDRFAEARARRAEEMVKNLRVQGVDLDFAEVREEAGLGVIGRPHIAAALHRKGFVRSFDEAFYVYIGMHCPSYVRKYELKPVEAVDLVHGAGGLAVLAHPFAGRLGEDDVIELLDSGVDGIEVFHPKMSRGESDRAIRIAGERGLLVTGGSDYHGDNRGPGSFGESVAPASYVLALKDALRDRKRGATGMKS